MVKTSYKTGAIWALTKDIMQLDNIAIPRYLAGMDVMIMGRDKKGLYISEDLNPLKPLRTCWKVPRARTAKYFNGEV